MTFNILTPNDSEWAALFKRLPKAQQDVFYSPSFAQLCQATLNKEDEVLCAAMAANSGVILYPFVKRDLGKLTSMSGFGGFCDITSLYGRGGIAASQADPLPLASFHAEMAEYCRNSNVVCGFDRFHPIMANDAFAQAESQIMDVGGFVVVDMRPDLDIIENTFEYSLRKHLRKAERNSITCFAESNCDHLKDFLDIYFHTMDRNAAGQFYYFSEEYFLSLCQKIPGQFHFFYAMANGNIVSCELVLHHGKYCHSFLGGTRNEALPLCPNQMLKREIIKFLKGHGCEYFLLGGGTRPDDGIFNYKKTFAPEGVLPSRIGGTIWNPQAYKQLKEEMSAAGADIAESRFQFYDNCLSKPPPL